MVTHVSRCIWTGLLHDASGFYQFMEEVVTAKSVRLEVALYVLFLISTSITDILNLNG